MDGHCLDVLGFSASNLHTRRLVIHGFTEKHWNFDAATPAFPPSLANIFDYEDTGSTINPNIMFVNPSKT